LFEQRAVGPGGDAAAAGCHRSDPPTYSATPTKIRTTARIPPGLIRRELLVIVGVFIALFWVLDHHLGQTLTGVYIQAFALRRILQTIALGGMRSAMTRFVAIDLADDDDASLRGTIAVGQRADLVGDPYFTGDRSHQAIISQYLNAAAFAAPLTFNFKDPKGVNNAVFKLQ
jgi:hypothetical protein